MPRKNILLVNITRLGDMLQATPTIAGLKEEYPGCKISVVVEQQFEGICKAIPLIDELYPIDLNLVVRSLSREREGILDAYEYFSDFIDKLRAKNFDYCLNLSSSPYTSMLISLINPPEFGGWIADEAGYRRIESPWARLFASSVFHQNRIYNSFNIVDVFRCSAGITKQPRNLLINLPDQDIETAKSLIAGAEFTGKGPLIIVQAGASQRKRQWQVGNFVNLINLLRQKLDARVILTGTKSELNIILPIVAHFKPGDLLIAAGRTSVTELASLVKECDLVITGDTGTMHIAAAVKVPIVSLFLASALGYETGPYLENSIIIQPVIACGPCNPSKSCMQTDCHAHITPELVFNLAEKRLAGIISQIPEEWVSGLPVRVYRTVFDKYGFYDLEQLHRANPDPINRIRMAYRKLWLKELMGIDSDIVPVKRVDRLAQVDPLRSSLAKIVDLAQEGCNKMSELSRLINDRTTKPDKLNTINDEIANLDYTIESLGYDESELCPLVRMFIFAKENLQGDNVIELTGQMLKNYLDLKHRAEILI
jgi:ADP-heptose:LPS heptosyltransferase